MDEVKLVKSPMRVVAEQVDTEYSKYVKKQMAAINQKINCIMKKLDSLDV